MNVAERHRQAYLERFRRREPTIARSVELWAAFDIHRWKAQGANAILNIPEEGFVSRPPKTPPPPPKKKRDDWHPRYPEKKSVYIPDEMLEELRAEATRSGRSLSALMQTAWREARAQLRKMPTFKEPSVSASSESRPSPPSSSTTSLRSAR